VVILTSRPLYPRERNPVSIKKDAGWAPEMLWTFLEKRKIVFMEAFSFL